MTAALLPAIALLPLLLAIAIALRPDSAGLQRLVPWAALPALLLAALAPAGLEITLEWLLIGTTLAIDAVGRAFLALTAGLWLAAGLFALDERRDDPGRHRFFVFWLLTLTGNLGLILAQDALAFYLFFSLMSLAAYALVAHPGSDEARRAGRVYLVLAVVGEVLLFAGLALAVYAAGGTRLEVLADARPEGWTLVLLVLGLGIKAGMLPLHFWLPLAHPAAPVPASAVLSGAMIKAGLLGWLRVLPIDAAGHAVLGETLVLLGLAAAFLAAVAGVAQSRPKTIIAYSSISQMGLMTTGVGLALLIPEARGWLIAAVTLYAVHHGLAKGALFLSAGMADRLPATGAGRAAFGLFAVLPALALAGLPFTSGALAKNALKGPLDAAELHGWLAHAELALTLAAVGTTLLMVRYLWRWRAGLGDAARPATAGRWWAWGGLSLMSLLMPAVALLAALAGAPVHPASLGGVSLVWPVVLGLALAGVTGMLVRERGRPWLPEGDLVILPEAAWRRLQGLRPTPRLSVPGRPIARWRWARYRMQQRLVAAERGLTHWPVIGLLFAAAALGVYVVLAPG